MADDSRKPSNAKERTAGIGGALASGLAILTFALDWISRGQILLAIYPYIHSPIVQIGEILLAVIGLLYATQRERLREEDDAPRIITLDTREPPKPKRHFFYMKLAGISVAIGVLIGISIFIWSSHIRGSRKSAPPSNSVSTSPGGFESPQSSPASSANKFPNTSGVNPGQPNSERPTQSIGSTGEVAMPNTANPSQPAPIQSNSSTNHPNPVSNSPIACPPKGALSEGWTLIYNNPPTPPAFKYEFEISSLSPLLRGMVHGDFKVLNEAPALSDASSLFEELRSQVPDPQPISTEKGSIPTFKVNGSLQHHLADRSFIQVSYVNRTQSGVSVDSHEAKVSIANLSEGGRRAVSDLDRYSSSLADTDCVVALRNLEATGNK